MKPTAARRVWKSLAELRPMEPISEAELEAMTTEELVAYQRALAVSGQELARQISETRAKIHELGLAIARGEGWPSATNG